MSIAVALLGSHSAHKAIYQSKERAKYALLKDLIEMLGKPLTEQQEAELLKDTLAAAGHVEMDTDEVDRFYDDINTRMKRYGDRKTQFDKGQLYKKRPLPDSPDAPTGSKTVQPEPKFRNIRKNQSGDPATPQLGVMGGKQPVKLPPITQPIIIPVVKPNVPLSKFGSAPSLLDTTTVKSTGTSTEPNKNKNILKPSSNNGNNKAANKTGVAGKSQQLPAVPAPVPPISTVPVEQQQLDVAPPIVATSQPAIVAQPIPADMQPVNAAPPKRKVNRPKSVSTEPKRKDIFVEHYLVKLPISRMSDAEFEFYKTTKSYENEAEPNSEEYKRNTMAYLRKMDESKMSKDQRAFFHRYRYEYLDEYLDDAGNTEQPFIRLPPPQGEEETDVFHDTVENVLAQFEPPVLPMSEVLGEALNAVAAAETVHAVTAADSISDPAAVDADTDMLNDA
ncbi:cadherin-related family member 5-like isoform X1 [Paramacrobiotus metropolitanus]|uniref:cadherin-related family member 5-like isoform X1 n=1 Tax=Paramacrobiotus metropolitanus TaxID=2943436 RepID=UPI002445EAD9|nr:cadherin-related family member 5-like isoform X1 [Paramacrobiotus metropolitanus]